MPDKSALIKNKRECFDGMRAYHQSEISHTHHAITMLLSIVAVVSTVAVAILFPERPSPHAAVIAWGLFIAALILGGTVALAAHIKIKRDHRVYATFGTEYMKTAVLLGFYGDSKELPKSKDEIPQNAIKQSITIGQGPGYRKTQRIIWSFYGALLVLTLMFACTVHHLT